MSLTKVQLDLITTLQRFEISEYHVYQKLASVAKVESTRQSLLAIANVEMEHYEILKGYTQIDVAPNKRMIWKYSAMARIFGLHFTLHFMERGEKSAQVNYDALLAVDPVFHKIQQEEKEHESELIGLIDSNVMKYVGSFVLGLNDAIVEITGTVAGLTVALANTRLIGMVGLIGGIAAAMSMAGSEYLSTKEDNGDNPKKAAAVTGVAYLITVALLIWPYFVFTEHFVALGFTLASSVIVIAVFNFYISVAKNVSFKSRFIEMTVISLGVAAISFVIGELISRTFGMSL